MDDFVNILQRDYGLKPQGKSAPMSVSSAKSTIPQSSSSSLFSSSSSSGKNNRNSMENLSFGPAMGGILEDEDFLFGTSMASKNGVKSASLNLDTFGSASAFDKTTGMSPIYDDVFGVKFSSSQTYQRPKQSASSHHDDDIFEMQSNYHPRPVSSSSKKPTDSSVNVASSLPIFDGPLYDDDGSDIFGGLPGIKSTNVIYDDVFGGGGGVPSSSVNASSSVFDDILGVPMQTNPKDRASNTRSVAEPSAPLVDFDDLLPGFGGSEPAKSRKLYEGEDVPQKSGKDIPKKPENDSFHMAEEDPFIVLQTTVPTTAGTVGDANVWASFHSASEHTRDRTNDGNIGASGNSSQLGNEPQSPYRKKVNESTAKQETEQTNGDSVQRGKFHSSNSLANNDVRSSSSPNNHVENSSSHGKQNKQVLNEVSGDSPQRSKAVGKRNEVWVSVEDVKLVTQPTTAPPPARRPPPLPSSRQSNAAMNRVNGELKEDRDMMERSASASSRATEDATERVRSKLQDRGKEEKVADTRATGMRDMKEKVSDITGDDGRAYRDEDSKANEGEERRAKEIEREEREKESREKWQKEREREKEKEREREREKDRIAVERATQEARERAATEARQRAAVERATAEARERAAAEARERAAAERAAVERANAEARERAAAEAREKAAVERATAEARERAAIEAREKAAVERATAEARERAAAEARERAAAERAAVEKATAEARERAAAEARERAAAERAAAERAAVERATSEARARAERAAVERATKEARDRAAERAASGARERAEKAAVEKNAATREQRKNEDDLEAFFSSSSRAGSAPKQRSPPKTNKPSNEESHKSSNATATVNKVVTPTTFADDWTSLFGAASNAGEFQEVEGETSERRRARLERHQRTAERAAKALDEKNKRDLQTQREQAERHRAGDILDSEIKRWAAGKEGNIRALLSTLQYVLWPECGWQAVSLTDLITGAAVKKVYRKATLCVHPDKVQQKGATIQQKYIAEKVFDLLKEAWNKFNSEELF